MDEETAPGLTIPSSATSSGAKTRPRKASRPEPFSDSILEGFSEMQAKGRDAPSSDDGNVKQKQKNYLHHLVLANAQRRPDFNSEGFSAKIDSSLTRQRSDQFFKLISELAGLGPSLPAVASSSHGPTGNRAASHEREHSNSVIPGLDLNERATSRPKELAAQTAKDISSRNSNLQVRSDPATMTNIFKGDTTANSTPSQGLLHREQGQRSTPHHVKDEFNSPYGIHPSNQSNQNANITSMSSPPPPYSNGRRSHSPAHMYSPMASRHAKRRRCSNSSAASIPPSPQIPSPEPTPRRDGVHYHTGRGSPSPDYHPSIYHRQPLFSEAPTYPEPALPVPGNWLVKVGAAESRVLEAFVDIDEGTWARWKQKGDSVTLRLLCLPTMAVAQTQQPLMHSMDVTPEKIALVVSTIQTQWPPPGHLVVEINKDSDHGHSWLPIDLKGGAPLDLTPFVRRGRNELRFIQLANLSDFTFILTAFPKIDRRVWTAQEELADFLATAQRSQISKATASAAALSIP